jgi:hypothetical protein
MPDPAFVGFDAELASALDDLGRRVRPREFDPDAILRSTARRRSARLLATSAAAVALVAGATAFAVRPGDVHGPTAAQPTAPSTTTATGGGTDPNVVPGLFRTTPVGGSANGFAQFGATTSSGMDLVTDGGGVRGWLVETDWTADGVDLTGRVSWLGPAPQITPPKGAGSVVGTVNGHPAYDAYHQLTFWSGAQGYATADIFKDGVVDQSATSADLLELARSLDTTPAEVPMPIRIAGLDVADVTNAGIHGNGPGQGYPWGADIFIVVDGRSYQVDVVPGPANAPTPTGTQTTTGNVSAERTVDGLGITVTTGSGKQGSPQAPTPADVLAHITSLGSNPSDWTTNVIVR